MTASILVVGSVAFDSLKTPLWSGHDGNLGGAATYFSVAARATLRRSRVVAVVGDDFPEKTLSMCFAKHKIDISGIGAQVPGRTFRWKGEYGFDLNEAKTLDTQLNVFETFKPVIPEAHRSSEYVFLGEYRPRV